MTFGVVLRQLFNSKETGYTENDKCRQIPLSISEDDLQGLITIFSDFGLISAL